MKSKDVQQGKSTICYTVLALMNVDAELSKLLSTDF